LKIIASINFSLFLAMVLALVLIIRISCCIYKHSQINSKNLMIVLIMYKVSFLDKAFYIAYNKELAMYINENRMKLL